MLLNTIIPEQINNKYLTWTEQKNKTDINHKIVSFCGQELTLSVVDSRVVGSVNLPVVLLGELSKSQETHDANSGIQK